MEEAKKEIQNAWRLLSTLPVSGDAVDVLAACRMALRKAYAAVQGAERNKEAQSDRGQDTPEM